MLYNVLLFSCVFSQREADVANLLELSDRFRRLLSLVWLIWGFSCAHSWSGEVKNAFSCTTPGVLLTQRRQGWHAGCQAEVLRQDRNSHGGELG